jgi:hypothetical protein
MKKSIYSLTLLTALILLFGIFGMYGCGGSSSESNAVPDDSIKVPADYSTIQAAINAAVDGDTVLVSDGTYTEKIDFNGKAITVQSVNGAASTTIDGGDIFRVVSFLSGELATSVLNGFTITNGYSLYGDGGGIYCYSSSPTITNCTIIGNSAHDGGGIYCYSSSPTITNCDIRNNAPDNVSGC